MASLLQKVLQILNLMDAEHYCRSLYGFKRIVIEEASMPAWCAGFYDAAASRLRFCPQVLQIALTHA